MRNCDQVASVQAVPNVVVSIPVVLQSQIEGINRVSRAVLAQGVNAEGHKTAVRDLIEGVTVSIVKAQGHILRLIFDRYQQAVVVGAGLALNLSNGGERGKRRCRWRSAKSISIHSIVDDRLVISVIANIPDLDACGSADLLLDLQAVLLVSRVVDVLIGVINRG